MQNNITYDDIQDIIIYNRRYITKLREALTKYGGVLPGDLADEINYLRKMAEASLERAESKL